MASSSSSLSSTHFSSSLDQPEDPIMEKKKQRFHKIKRISFLNHSIPIIIENESGACPLVAICNVFLLKSQQLKIQNELLNHLPTDSDNDEETQLKKQAWENKLLKHLQNARNNDDVSQEELRELVIDQMIEIVRKNAEDDSIVPQNQVQNISDGIDFLSLQDQSISDSDGTDFLSLQDQSISDAIELLPRFTAEMDFNLKFDRIHSFGLTEALALFDLLNISLYHGWLVDPQDKKTARAIGSKSFNAITWDLVAILEKEVAAFDDPSPCLSRTNSSDDSSRHIPSSPRRFLKGDAMEAVELLRALKLSLTESSRQGGSVEPNASVENQTARFVENLEKLVYALASSDDMLDVCSKDQAEPYAPSRGSLFDKGEQIHEVDKCVTDDSILTSAENQDPVVYEKSAHRTKVKGKKSTKKSKDELTRQDVELISKFLMKSYKRQLTSHGLLSLQGALINGDLCVFVNKNQFRPMLKFDGHLYILVTDLAFLNQPDLVWAKLEVNGGSMFMTSDFKEFKLSDEFKDACDEQVVVS